MQSPSKKEVNRVTLACHSKYFLEINVRCRWLKYSPSNCKTLSSMLSIAIIDGSWKSSYPSPFASPSSYLLSGVRFYEHIITKYKLHGKKTEGRNMHRIPVLMLQMFRNDHLLLPWRSSIQQRQNLYRLLRKQTQIRLGLRNFRKWVCSVLKVTSKDNHKILWHNHQTANIKMMYLSKH